MTTTASPLTGREPRLSVPDHVQGRWHLSLKNVAAMLNVLPPEAVSLSAAAAALNHHDYFVRRNAAKLLNRRGDRDARMVLQAALTGGSAPTRASAARFLYGFSWFAVEPLIQQALADADARVREAAVSALCEMRQLNAYRLIVDTLQQEEDNVRAAAAWGLQDCQDPDAVPVLEAVLLARDEEVRVKALEVLGMNGLPQGIPVVKKALADPHLEVVYAAALSWIELAQEDCLPELASVVAQAGGPVKEALVRGFFHATNYLKIDLTGPRTLVPSMSLLSAAVTDPYAPARMAAGWPLAWIRHPQAAALLKQAYFHEQNAEVKAHFIYVAINLFSEVGDELLAAGQQSDLPVVRDMACHLKKDLSDGIIVRAPQLL